MSRTVVVGGGVIGLLAAHELRRRGAAVTVLDAGNFGAACSAGNAGWVVPSLSGPVPAPGLVSTSLRWMLRRDSPLYIRPRAVPRLARWLLAFWRHCNERDYRAGLEATARFNRATMDLFDRLAQEGVEFEMHRDGMLFAFFDPASLHHVLEEIEAMRPFGYGEPRLLGPSDLREFEPALSPDVKAGVWVREDRHVRPETLSAGLVKRLAAGGVELRPRTPVTGFRRQGHVIVGVEVRGETIVADQVLIAAGAWSGQVAALAGARLPLQAGKGYNLTIAEPDTRLAHPIYLNESMIACSPFVGALRLSGTMELSGINTVLNERRVGAIRRGAERYLGRSPRGRAETSWVGMRPLTPDGLPAVGRVPGHENLFVATGHAMLGVTLGPVTAVAIADLMRAGSSEINLSAFDPARFAARSGLQRRWPAAAPLTSGPTRPRGRGESNATARRVNQTSTDGPTASPLPSVGKGLAPSGVRSDCRLT